MRAPKEDSDEKLGQRERRAKSLIVAGAVTPMVVLAGLLSYGLRVLARTTAPAPPGTLQISVQGKQWWWRVRYLMPGAPPFELANEIHLPVGEPVEFLLESDNVIHSFWIPALGGKMDLIPGRVNRLVLRPTRVGVFQGVCAEFCGKSHAKMAFQAIVVARPDFDAWVANQRQYAKPEVSVE